MSHPRIAPTVASIALLTTVLIGCEQTFTLASGGAGGATTTGATMSTTTTTVAGPGATGTSATTGTGMSQCPETGDPDLVAYYPLDETSGTAVHDCSGNGHDGNVISAMPGGGWGAGHFAGGFTGDGNVGCIDLGADPEFAFEGAPFTVAAWVKANTFSTGNSGRYIASRTLEPDSGGWRMGGDVNSKLGLKYFDLGANAPMIVDSTTMQTPGVWLHVVGTFEPSVGTKVYVNAALTGSGTLSSVKPDSNADLRIGCKGSNDLYFDGTIDEVRFYKRAFTAQEVSDLFMKTK